MYCVTHTPVFEKVHAALCSLQEFTMEPASIKRIKQVKTNLGLP